jgi:hypothetical protein
MLDLLRRAANPGNAACVAALLIAIGFEIDEPLLKHAFDILGGLVAILGFFLSRSAAPSA